MNDDVFEQVYPEFRALVDLKIAEGASPMAVFGVMLGIIAQEYKKHASLEEFREFLLAIAEAEWPDPSKKRKPNLTIVQ